MATTERSTSDAFARQVAANSAQRGRMDPIYQDLSDHYTRVLQRMYPVWALVAPGVADPAHIDLKTRTVSLDSDELVGTRDELSAGKLDPIKVLTGLGAGVHEVFHGVHTKVWISERDAELLGSEDPLEVQLGHDRRLLEEPRMEANGCRDYEETTRRGAFIRKALRAAVGNVILPRFTARIIQELQMTGTVSRDMCGTSMVYLQARTHYGAVDPATLTELTKLWEAVLGDDDVKALDDLFARLIWAPDGENEPLDVLAREYRDIIGLPDPPPASPAGGGDEEDQDADDDADEQEGEQDTGGEQPADGGSPDEGDGQGEGTGTGTGNGQGAPGTGNGNGGTPDTRQAPGVGEALADKYAEAVKDAAGEVIDGILQQYNEDFDLQQITQEAAGAADPTTGPKSRGTGAPTGRMPDRGVDRPPLPDEIQQAVAYANRMQAARAVGTKQIPKRTPGGSFNARAYVRGCGQRRRQEPVTSHAWEIQQETRTPLLEPHVALVEDTSGSMGAYEYALGPITWMLDHGLRRIGGQVAVSLFGNGCSLLSDGSRPMPKVPGIKVGGGTAFGGEAIDMAVDCLDFDNPMRPCFLYLLSDGGWMDTHAGVKRIRALKSRGIPTYHLSIGALPPLGVECDEIFRLEDPASVMDVIARHTVEALRKPPRRAR